MVVLQAEIVEMILIMTRKDLQQPRQVVQRVVLVQEIGQEVLIHHQVLLQH